MIGRVPSFLISLGGLWFGVGGVFVDGYWAEGDWLGVEFYDGVGFIFLPVDIC